MNLMEVNVKQTTSPPIKSIAWQKGLLGLGLLLLFGLTVVAIHELFTQEFVGANDFYPRWKGAQMYWLEGHDPYSQATTEAIQQDMYGRLALPHEDQVLFVYPFYTIFLLLPLVSLPYSWVQAIWLTVVTASLVGGVLLTLSYLGWRPPLWLLALSMVWTVTFYSSVRTIILGQFAGPVFLGLVGCLWLLKNERDGWAGLILVLATLKPQMSYLFIPALLLWAWGQRRWYFMASFAGWLSAFVLLSFWLSPRWLISFAEQVLYYPDYTAIGAPVWIITQYYFPVLGQPGEWILSLLLIGYMLYLWRQLPDVSLDTPAFLYTLSITILVTNMVVTRTGTTNYVMLYLPLFWLLQTIAARWRRGEVGVVLFYGLSLAGFWVLFLTTIEGNFENPIMYLPMSIGLLLALVAGRHWLQQTPHLSGESVREAS
jgi:hypothetical protein